MKLHLDHHLKANNQNYFDHLLDTLQYSIISGTASVVFLIHGLFPFTFTSLGSELVSHLNYVITVKKSLNNNNNTEEHVE